jgi:hypothetical protein
VATRWEEQTQYELMVVLHDLAARARAAPTAAARARTASAKTRAVNAGLQASGAHQAEVDPCSSEIRSMAMGDVDEMGREGEASGRDSKSLVAARRMSLIIGPRRGVASR